MVVAAGDPGVEQFFHMHPDMAEIVESAARMQQIVPDAVLVGGTAAALFAHYRDSFDHDRDSFDHDHVVTDLRERFDVINDALDREPEWVLNRSVPGKVILGELGGIETGLRQLIRTRPLEVMVVTLPSGHRLTVPTVPEIERIKAFLIVKRNQVRDYLDVAALADSRGIDACAETLCTIDDYYRDDTRPITDLPVVTQLVRQLAHPQPKDSRTIARLFVYKGLAQQWQDWEATVAMCQQLASLITRRHGRGGEAC